MRFDTWLMLGLMLTAAAAIALGCAPAYMCRSAVAVMTDGSMEPVLGCAPFKGKMHDGEAPAAAPNVTLGVRG